LSTGCGALDRNRKFAALDTTEPATDLVLVHLHHCLAVSVARAVF